MLGLDRKQMEVERLARQAGKRGVEQSSVGSPPAKIQRTDAESVQPTTPAVSPQAEPLPKSESISPSTSTNIKYPNGSVKRTFSLNHPRTSDDTTLSEVLEPPTLSIAVISSWQLDTQYLFSKLSITRTKLYLIMHSKHISDQETFRRDAAQLSPNIRLCFPIIPPGPGGVMHSKLMLLFHPTKLRIVVPSANMMSYDWGETGVMENVIFLLDLPRLPEERQGNENDTLTPFALDLVEYLEAQTVAQDVRDGVLKFDFSQTAHLAWVNTVAGTHSDQEAQQTGFPQLASAVQALGLETKGGEPTHIDYAASSIGRIDSRIFSDLYYAFRGVSPIDAPVSEGTPDFLVHYPSRDTVMNSMGGPGNAGTLFFAPQKVDGLHQDANLVDRFRDAQSTRSGLLSHAKMAVVRTKDKAFVYVGSANVSQAAWGRWTQGKKKGSEAKLAASNWECGVLMRIDVDDVEKVASEDVVPLKALEGKVPLLFETPGRTYDSGGKVKKPWTQTRSVS